MTDYTAIPPHAAGQRIGLFGGSFNPIHDGHRLVAEQCLRRLALDAVWLLVSPGNPLKDHSDLTSLEARVAAAREIITHPRIFATGLEAQRDFHFTVDTLEWLVSSCPGVRFVWIMGADNLMQFDRWERWRDIAALMPIAAGLCRPGSTLRATSSPAAIALREARIAEMEAESLASRPTPAWVYLHGMMSTQSSSAIRAARRAQSS